MTEQKNLVSAFVAQLRVALVNIGVSQALVRFSQAKEPQLQIVKKIAQETRGSATEFWMRLNADQKKLVHANPDDVKVFVARLMRLLTWDIIVELGIEKIDDLAAAAARWDDIKVDFIEWACGLSDEHLVALAIRLARGLEDAV